MGAHSLFSPSASGRWLKCPGSLALTYGIQSESNPAADEGTMLHDVMYHHIKDNKPLSEFDLTDEQYYACSICSEYVKSEMKGEKLYETHVTFGSAIGQADKDAGGTVDIASIDDDGTLYVCDYKFGYNYVASQGNTQGMLYAIGLINLMNIIGYDVKKVRFAILQPRTGYDVDNGYDEWTVDELKEKAEEFKKACATGRRAVEEFVRNGVNRVVEDALVPGEDQCRWCKAKANCPALSRQVMKAHEEMAAEFNVVDADDIQAKVHSAPTESLAKAMKVIPLIKIYCDAVEKETMHRALDGEVINGYRLIDGKQGNRKWIDEEAAEHMLRSHGVDKFDCVVTSFITPPRAEQLLVKAGMKKSEAKNTIEDFVTRSEPKPYLVPDTQKGGREYTNLLSHEFEIVNN